MKPRSRRKPCSTPVRHLRRAFRGAALTSLCALALAACGTERPGEGADGDHGKAAAGVGAKAPSTAPPRTATDEEEEEGAEFLPFMKLLTSVAEPCATRLLPTPLPTEPTEEAPGEAPPTTPLPELSLPPEPPAPPSEPRDPEAAQRETELSPIEKCAARNHERRITEALGDLPAPTPQQVRTVLHRLGYIDQRIDGPRRSGDTVEFTLDLRLMDGELCQSGSVTGTRTVIDSYGGSAEVGCTDVKRR